MIEKQIAGYADDIESKAGGRPDKQILQAGKPGGHRLHHQQRLFALQLIGNKKQRDGAQPKAVADHLTCGHKLSFLLSPWLISDSRE